MHAFFLPMPHSVDGGSYHWRGHQATTWLAMSVMQLQLQPALLRSWNGAAANQPAPACCTVCGRLQAYEGLRTADRLDEQYVFIPQKVKDVYLHHLLITSLASLQQEQPQLPAARGGQAGATAGGSRKVRSAIVFVSTCKGCHMLSLVLKELGLPAAALHSGEPHGMQSRVLISTKPE